VHVEFQSLPGIEWSQVGPWRWERTGTASEGLGDTWIIVDESPVPPANNVRVTTNHGVLFFRYQNNRTVLQASMAFRKRPGNPRELVFDPSLRDDDLRTRIDEVAVGSGRSGEPYDPVAGPSAGV
jgi:hypothetical protein